MQPEPKVVKCRILILAFAPDENVRDKFYVTFEILRAPEEVKESVFFQTRERLSGYTFEEVADLQPPAEVGADVIFQGSPTSRNYQLGNFSK